jgi:hypothetical protein
MEPSNSTAGTDTGRGIVDRVRSAASAQVSTQKDRATDTLGTLAGAVRQSTQSLRDQHQDTVAQFVERAADQVERWSATLRDRDVGQLMTDVQQFARRQPALFIGGAFVGGVLVARFLKSSGHGTPSGDWRESGEHLATSGDRSRTSPDYGSHTASGHAGARR